MSALSPIADMDQTGNGVATARTLLSFIVHRRVFRALTTKAALSRCGDEMMRTTLYEAAQVMLLRSAKWSWFKAWVMKIARHRGSFALAISCVEAHRVRVPTKTRFASELRR